MSDDEADPVQEAVDRALRRIEGGAAAVLAALCGMLAIGLLIFRQPGGAAMLTLAAVLFAFFSMALFGAGREDG